MEWDALDMSGTPEVWQALCVLLSMEDLAVPLYHQSIACLR